MGYLMHLPFFMTLIRMYRRKAFLDHYLIIMIVSGYTHYRKISMVKSDPSEWVPTYLLGDPIHFSPKESVPDLSDLVVLWGVIVVL